MHKYGKAGIMLFKCTESFETREAGYPQVVDKGEVLYFSGMSYAMGGYEVAVMERVREGQFTGVIVRMRLERLESDFERVPMRESVVYLHDV